MFLRELQLHVATYFSRCQKQFWNFAAGVDHSEQNYLPYGNLNQVSQFCVQNGDVGVKHQISAAFRLVHKICGWNLELFRYIFVNNWIDVWRKVGCVFWLYIGSRIWKCCTWGLLLVIWSIKDWIFFKLTAWLLSRVCKMCAVF